MCCNSEHTHACMYGDVRSMPNVCPLSTLFFEPESLTEPGKVALAVRLTSQQHPRLPLSPYMPWGYRQAPPDDFHVAVGIWTQVLTPALQAPDPLETPFLLIFDFTHVLSLLLHLFLGVLGLDLLQMILNVMFFPTSYILCMSKPLIGAYCLKLIRLLCIYCFNIFLLFWFPPGIQPYYL